MDIYSDFPIIKDFPFDFSISSVLSINISKFIFFMKRKYNITIKNKE